MKYKLGYLSILFSGLLSISAHAQLYLGIEAGGNKNYLYTNNASQSFTDYNGASGLTFGIPILYKFNDWFSLQADPSYIQKNYKIQRTDFFEGVYQNNNNKYLQLPLAMRFSFGGKQIKGFVNLGAYVAYWSAGSIKGSEPNILNPVDTAYSTVNPAGIYGENNAYTYNEKYPFNSTKDNRLETGLIAGLGMSYELHENYQFFVEGRYSYSLSDQQKKYMMNQVARYNDTYGITAGFLFNLKTVFNNPSR